MRCQHADSIEQTFDKRKPRSPSVSNHSGAVDERRGIIDFEPDVFNWGTSDVERPAPSGVEASSRLGGGESQALAFPRCGAGPYTVGLMDTSREALSGHQAPCTDGSHGRSVVA